MKKSTHSPKISRRKLLLASAGAIVPMAMQPSRAVAQEVTMTLHHFLGPKAPAHAKFLEPWARKIETESGGKIKIELFPSMSMGGKPPELFAQVRDGVADIVWTLPGYTPGQFPRSEVFELPGVHRGNAKATNLAIQDIYSMVADDFKDVKVLLLFAHAGNAIHTVDKAVRAPADLKGLKLRTPSRTGAWVIEAYGAEPVGMPLPSLPEALSKKAVDGALIPFEVVPAIKLQEMTKYSIQGADGSRFGTSLFLFAMNKSRYDGLSDDLKKVIDANSGVALAPVAGDLWNSFEEPGKKMRKDAGGEIIELTADEKAAFAALDEGVVNRWIDEATKNGLDGKGLVEAAKAAMAKTSG
jgi:TRAP-type C4-dicarboxylate transport system substrate-binding protein